MANLSLSFTLANGTTADASEVQTNFNDGVTYINARNAASADWDAFSCAGLMTGKATLRMNDGSVTVPSVSFTSDTNTGIYWVSADILGVTTGGTEAVRFNASQQALFTDGAVGAPAVSFAADLDCGAYRVSADRWALVVGGVSKIDMASTATLLRNQCRFGDGTVSAPSVSFESDVDTGIYRIGADQIGLATTGTLRMNVATAAIVATIPLRAADGSVSAPSHSFSGATNTGIYRSGANMNMTVVGTSILGLASNGNVVVGDGSGLLATTATSGFLWIRATNGTPTGNPGTFTGSYPMVYDSSANKIWVYNGSWRGVVVT